MLTFAVFGKLWGFGLFSFLASVCKKICSEKLKSDLRDIEWKFDGIEIGCKGAVQSYAIEGKLLELSGSTGGAAAWENN